MAKTPSAADIKAVESRLGDVAYALLAMRQLTLDAVDSTGNNEIQEHYLVALQELARSTFKGIDACLVRLGGQGMGDFLSEFDECEENGKAAEAANG